MTDFVKTNHTDVVMHKSMKVKLAFAEFKRILQEQMVCPVCMSNARDWYCEVPEYLLRTYLRKRDHRARGALLHTDALNSARTEQQAMKNYPFSMPE